MDEANEAGNLELYEEWLKRIGSKELTESDPKFVGTNKRICSIHFSSHCRIPNSTKLKNRSLPTLHLPGFKEAASEENSILKYPRRTITIARAELLRYIEDFKPDPEDLDVDESKPSKQPADPVAVSDRDACEIQQPGVEQPAVKTSRSLVCNRLLTEAIESLDKEISRPALDVLPANKAEPDVKDVKPLSLVLDYISPGDSDTENSITEPMNIDFTYLMKITSLPDSPLIKDESPLIKDESALTKDEYPPVKYSQVKKSITRPLQPDVVPEPPNDDDDDYVTNIEPMNIDFTYLMKITSLPDTPLIKDDESPLIETENVAQPPIINLPDVVVDCLPYSTSSDSPALEDPLNHSNLMSSTFDLEEFLRESCKSLSTEIPSTSYHCYSPGCSVWESSGYFLNCLDKCVYH